MCRNSFRAVLRFFSTAVFFSVFCLELSAHENHAADASGSQQVEVTARIDEYRSDDFTNRKSARHYYATDVSSGQTYEIHFDKKAPKHFKTGNTLKLKGTLKDNDLYLNSDEAEHFAAIGVITGGSYTSSATGLSGNQNTLVIGIDSNDGTISCTDQQISDLMFNSVTRSVNYMYQDASYGALTFSGQVHNHIKINVNSAGACDYSGWASLAEKELQARGIATTGFNKKVYILPPGNGCGWAGLARVSGVGAWINGGSCNTPDVYAHELGHNFGLNHAKTPTSEYGDYSDLMGIGGVGLRTVNAPHKAWLGWTPASKIVNGGVGTYTIAPLELNPNEVTIPQIIKIAKPNTNEFYYLSYRRAIGYDTVLRTTYVDKLNIHTAQGSYTTFLGAFADGMSFADSVNGVSITVLGHSADSLTFRVDGSCTTNASKLTLSPASQAGAIGQTLKYSAVIQNADSPFCPASTFSLSAVLPAGLSGSFLADTVSIPAGSSASAVFSVTAEAGAPSGSLTFQVSIADGIAAHAAEASGAFVIDAQAPTAPVSLSGRVSKNKIVLVWQASSDDIGVVSYEVQRNGVTVGSTSALTYTDSVRKGSFTYQVRARDAAGNVSAWSNVIIINK